MEELSADDVRLPPQEVRPSHALAHVRRANGTVRERTIALLDLRPGQAVLDVGSGPGTSYELLLEGVGEQGLVMGIEHDPVVFDRARDRVVSHGWTNVWHACRSAQTIRLPQPADAVLFHDVHDVCCAPAAVDNLMRQVKLGAHVAVYGLKYFPWWLVPLNVLPWWQSRLRHTHPAGLWRPWECVEHWCDDFAVEPVEGGMGYIAHGRRAAEVLT